MTTASYTSTHHTTLWYLPDRWTVDKCRQQAVRLHLVGMTIAKARAYLSKIKYPGIIVPATGSDEVVISSVTMSGTLQNDSACAGLIGVTITLGPAYDNGADFGTISSTASITLTVPAALVNPAIVLFQRSVTDVPGAADGFAPLWHPSGSPLPDSQPLTKIEGVGLGTTDQTQVWLLVGANPGTLSGETGVLHMTGTGYMTVGGAMVISGIDPVSPVVESAIASGTGQLTSVSVTATGGASVVDFAASHSGLSTGGVAPTVAGSQTEAWSGTSMAFGRTMNRAGGYGDATPSWDLGSSLDWTAAAVALQRG